MAILTALRKGDITGYPHTKLDEDTTADVME